MLLNCTQLYDIYLILFCFSVDLFVYKQITLEKLNNKITIY